jgi:GNAT superfamily N-acetyltransferase
MKCAYTSSTARSLGADLVFPSSSPQADKMSYSKMILKEMRLLACICLKHQLHQTYGLMRGVFESILKNDYLSHIVVIVKHENDYVGAVTLNLTTNQLMVFVKQDHRRKGFGRQVVKDLLDQYALQPSQVHANYGSSAGVEFFDSLGIVTLTQPATTGSCG